MGNTKTFIVYGKYGAIGFEFAGSVIAGLFIGDYADANLGTGPFLMVLGVMVGIAAGTYRLVVTLGHLDARGKAASDDRENRSS